jgi:hypothetical protein
MYAWALMVETYRRWPLIRLVHVLFLIIYAALLVLSVCQDELPPPELILFLIGVALPLALSMGIFGNDIASGRFRELAAEPLPLSAYYFCRVTGLLIQGALHLAFLGGSLLLLHAITGLGSIDYLGQALFVTFVLYATFATLSTSISVFAKAGADILIIILPFLLYIAMYFVRKERISPAWAWFLDWGLTAGKYALPPVFLLDKCVTWRGAIGVALHGSGLILIYALFAIILLHRKEFKPQRA